MDKKFNILMIAPTPFFADRGCHVRILEEIKALQKLGNKVTLFTYGLGRDIPGISIKRSINFPWYKKLSAGPSWHMLYIDPILGIKCMIGILKKKPDIIHSHLHEGTIIAYFARVFRPKIPIIFDFQGSLTSELIDHKFIKESGFFYKFMYFTESKINKMPDIIVTSSSNSTKQLISDFNINDKKVYTIMDGVNSDEITPGEDRLKIREKFEIPKFKRIIIYVGVLNKYQGIDLLLETISILKERKEAEKIHFLIVGFPEKDYIEMSKKMEISNMITFTGKVTYSKVPNYLRAADIAITPKISQTEANLKVFSYMAVGIPTICFDNPVNREILGKLGVYAELGDKDSLANTIMNLVNIPGKIKELGEKSR
ncbi:MAG: glycosyltransferase family 4 protein, partial [Actinomycetota bacterium]